MSKIDIQNKIDVLRNETTPKGNTKVRVADIMEETLAIIPADADAVPVATLEITGTVKVRGGAADPTVYSVEASEAAFTQKGGYNGSAQDIVDLIPETASGWTEDASYEMFGTLVIRKILGYYGGVGTVPAELTANIEKYNAKAGGFTTDKSLATVFTFGGDGIYKQGGLKTETYPFSGIVGTVGAPLYINAAVTNRTKVKYGGVLKILTYKVFNSSYNSNILVTNEELSTYFEYNVTINGLVNDISSLGIIVNEGDYIYLPTRYQELLIDTTYTENEYGINTSGAYQKIGNGRINVSVTIEKDLGETITLKDKITDNSNRISTNELNISLLDNTNIWQDRNVLHIGTSISDGRTVPCTWFAQAMDLVNCPNGTNRANSGKGATWHASNYDTEIAPYIANCYLFTIEHATNDSLANIANAETLMTPNLSLFPTTLGFDISDFFGAMAYIITRARSENMAIKIAIMGYWNEYGGQGPAQTLVMDKFTVPFLKVWQFMGATQQLVTHSETIGGTFFNDTRSIIKWYSSYGIYDGDQLHPFNPIAQKKYASIYANWINNL